jgi:hypothetical protein
MELLLACASQNVIGNPIKTFQSGSRTTQPCSHKGQESSGPFITSSNRASAAAWPLMSLMRTSVAVPYCGRSALNAKSCAASESCMSSLAAAITAPRAHRFTALAEIGDICSPFASRASSPRHQCCSFAIRARALSIICFWSGLAIEKIRYMVNRTACSLVSGLTFSVIALPRQWDKRQPI